MNKSLFFAKRYLISKKSNNVINLITGVSVIGITVGSMALIIVLSVFNGFERLVISLFDSFNSEIQITPKSGKVFQHTDIPIEKIQKLPGVLYLAEILEENALVKYNDKQCIITLKGVSESYSSLIRLDTMLSEGHYMLTDSKHEYAVVGQGIAYNLGINTNDFFNPLTIYIPKRGKTVSLDPTQAFNSENILPSGIFSIQQEFDAKYVIVPLSFSRRLLEYNNEISSIEISLKKGTNLDLFKKNLKTICGQNFVVKDRFEQQALLYSIMKSEKWAIFLILTFILIIAAFTVVGSLSMLILEKKNDIIILLSMGANIKFIKSIFLLEGLLITQLGALFGLFLGGIICFLQQQFGFIKLNEKGSFVVNYYPVNLQVLDFVYILITVSAIGLLASWFPLRMISRKFMFEKVDN